jgi:hypothetical protein
VIYILTVVSAWLFWSDFLTCQMSLWAVSCFDHRRGLLMTEIGHFYFLQPQSMSAAANSVSALTAANHDCVKSTCYTLQHKNDRLVLLKAAERMQGGPNEKTGRCHRDRVHIRDTFVHTDINEQTLGQTECNTRTLSAPNKRASLHALCLA